jgi:hypothetical protein
VRVPVVDVWPVSVGVSPGSVSVAVRVPVGGGQSGMMVVVVAVVMAVHVIVLHGFVGVLMSVLIP